MSRRSGLFVVGALLVAGLAVPAAPTAAAVTTSAFAGQQGGYHALSPVRVLDTRTGLGGTSGPLGPGSIAVLQPQVPGGATAVVLNVTGTEPTQPTFLTVYPPSQGRPLASNLNLTPGETRANLVTVALDANGFVAFYNNSGSTHVVADLAGYYGGESGQEAGFTALPPLRVLDTRDNGGAPVGTGGSIELDLSARVPASATTVALNLTGVTEAAGPDSFVTVWPAGTTRPVVSNLNLTRGEARPNAVTVALGADRKLALFNNAGNVHLIVDLAGFYTPDYGALFQAVPPKRVLDTRVSPGRPVGPGLAMGTGFPDDLVPPSAVAVVLNVTGTEPTDFTFVTAFSSDRQQTFTTSNLNLAPGQTAPNLVNMLRGSDGVVWLRNNTGNTHLIADLAGYFVFPAGRCVGDCVAAFGAGELGELGVGLPGQTLTSPKTVFELSDATAVAGAGAGATGYALRSNGTVVAWGANGQGQLGNGWYGGIGEDVTNFRSQVPVPVVGLDHVTTIAAGTEIGLALRDDGTVWQWGAINADRTHPVLTPGRVPNLTGVTAIAAGARTGYALLSNGTVVAWGENLLGQLGAGTGMNWSDVPLPVVGLTDVTAIGGGGFSGFAVKSDRTVWAWGDNNSGQLGTDGPCPGPGNSCSSAAPVRVQGTAGITSISSDGAHVFAIAGSDGVLAWGDNTRGSLGIGVPCQSNCVVRTPLPMPGLTDVTSIAGIFAPVGTLRLGGGLATRSDGTVWGWGSNNQVPASSDHPAPMSGLTGVTSVAATGHAGFALVPSAR